MIHVLVAYRRSTQELLIERVYDAARRHDAMAERFRLDEIYWDDDDVEVVVLSAADIDTVRTTHGRYFLSSRELSDRLIHSSRSAKLRRALVQPPTPPLAAAAG